MKTPKLPPLLASFRKILRLMLGPLFTLMTLLVGLWLCRQLASPFFYALRPLLYWALAGWAVLQIFRYRSAFQRQAQRQALGLRQKLQLTLKRINLALALVLVLTTLTSALQREFHYHWIWQQNSPEFQKLGQHFIVGFRDFNEIKKLAKQGAIGGVYWSRSHFRRKDLKQIRQEIKTLQQLRQDAGLPPLIMSLDEEGGIVSALQERLGPQPSLADFSEAHGNEEKIHARIRALSVKKAKQLKKLGFTVNFAPVVDLKFPQTQGFLDTHSLISQRSAGQDPDRVAARALEYSQTLLQEGITPTLKHFPGLGRVTADTHFFSGSLNETLATLEQSDLKPFRNIFAQAPVWTMLSHTKLTTVDAQNPVSVSPWVIEGLLRHQWQHDGILITDDLSMGPIVGRPGGVGQASVDALNAGVDYLLISKDPRLFYTAMSALLRAQQRGQLKESALVKSAQRRDLWQQQREGVAFHESSLWKQLTQNLARHFPQDPAVAARRLSATLIGNTTLPVALEP